MNARLMWAPDRLLSKSLEILSVRAVISARVALLMSPLSMLAGKAKVANEKSAALHSTESFMLATTISDVKGWEVRMWKIGKEGCQVEAW